MTRLHPFEFVFAEFAREHFPAIQKEAPDPNVDLGTMARLPAAQNALRVLGVPDADASAPAVGEYLALLFATYRFWTAGRPSLSVGKTRLEEVLAHPPIDHRAIPDGACYIQLPERLFWATIGEDAPHEPVDGMFVIGNAARRDLTVVAVLGFRAGREGFSQVTVAASVAEIAAAETTLRTPPFAPVMEGGAEAGFHSVTSEAELLHLTRLALDSATE
ncbi:MAG: hypothetical protein V3T28_02410 [Gemmatimonadales bacterium]